MESVEKDIEAKRNEILKIESDIETLIHSNERLKEQIENQDKQKEKLKQGAMDSFMTMTESSTDIAYKKKLLYMITRLTWHDKALRQNLIKGFVHNTKGDDVSVFEMDAKKCDNPTLISVFLWDYIGSGTAQNWK